MNWKERAYQGAPVWVQTALLNAFAFQIRSHRYGSAYREASAQLARSDRWDAARIRLHQDAALRDMVCFAYERSPFYRNRLDRAGIRPGDVRGVADLPLLPILTKDDVRASEDDMLCRTSRSGWIDGHTSGTTGTPLGVWYDRRSCALNNAVERRHKAWGGLAGGEWIGLVLGRVTVPVAQRRPPFWRRDFAQRQIWFSSFHLSEPNLPSYVEEIRRSGLRFLEGYPSTLYILARHLERHSIRLPMTAVFTSSETLHAVQRESIESAFGCRLFDYYGLAERVIFAGECEAHEGKHVAEEFGITEIVDGEGNPVPDGEPGFLVGTSLHNRAMPMIRYRTSDVSRFLPKPCSCGRASRRIADVTTKAEDIVVTPDGRFISPSILTHPFKPIRGLVESQVIQETPDRVRVKLVPGSDFDDSQRAALLRDLGARLGPTVRIEIELVGSIPRDASGKLRWVISNCRHDHLVRWSA